MYENSPSERLCSPRMPNHSRLPKRRNHDQHASSSYFFSNLLDQVPVADVLEVYASDVARHHARPEDAGHRIGRLLDFFADKTLADINGPLCRQYANQSSTDAMARRDLEELRAAVNHHRREGLHDRIVSVVLPARRPPRERWLDRDERAAERR